jgi:hypothetical protein
MPDSLTAISPYAYVNSNPLANTDPTGAMLVADGGGGGGSDTSPTPEPDPGQGPEEVDGPTPEELARAQQIQSKSWVDVILEAGGQILMEFLGVNDLLSCLNGDLAGCVSMVVGMLPWGKLFKAPKIAEAIYRAGKAVVKFAQELKWARAIIKGAKEAAQAAKAAAARAAREAAKKAAAARAAARRAAKEAAERAATKAKAIRSKAKKTGGDNAKDAPLRSADDTPTVCPVSLPRGSDSFVAGTMVVLADGTQRRIENLEPGDTIVATDPDTGKTTKSQVTHTIRTDHDKDFVDVTVRTKEGTASLTTTGHHPFWSATRGRWIVAGDLRPGERLGTLGGSHALVSTIRRYQGGHRTYNLTVDATHTYYVVAGTASVLVHNARNPIGSGPNGEPIYDIPQGSCGGKGAGKRITPQILRDHDIGVNARPGAVGPLCSYCRTNPATSVDHVFPRSRGGDLTDDNLTPACTHCNSSKGARPWPVNPPPNYTGPWPPPWKP